MIRISQMGKSPASLPHVLIVVVLLLLATTLITTPARTANASDYTGRVDGSLSGAGTASPAGVLFLFEGAVVYSGTHILFLCPDGTGSVDSDACWGYSPFMISAWYESGTTVTFWMPTPAIVGNPFDHFEQTGSALSTLTDNGPTTCPIIGGTCEAYIATAGGSGEIGTVTIVFAPPAAHTGTVAGDTSGAGTALSSPFLVWNATDESMAPQAYNLCPNGELALADTACMSTTSPDWLNQTLVVGETLQLWTYSPPPGGIPFSHFEYSGTGLGTFTDQGPDTCPAYGGTCEYYTATAGGEGETGTVTLVFEAPVVTLHAYPAYRGAVTVWNYSETPDTFNLYWSLNSSFTPKTLWANVSGTAKSYNATLPADTWGQNTYLQVVPVVGGNEQLDRAGTAQTLPATHRVVSGGITIIVSTTSEIKVRLDYRSLSFDPISSGVQIGEILEGSETPVCRAIMMVGPVTLPGYNSTGYYIIDWTPGGGIAPGTYPVWFFLWNRLPAEGGAWEPYTEKLIIQVVVT